MTPLASWTDTKYMYSFFYMQAFLYCMRKKGLEAGTLVAFM